MTIECDHLSGKLC